MSRMSHSRVTLTALLLLALVLGSGAWGAIRYHAQADTHRRTTTRAMYAYWWNDGSCHGYPDVMHVYAVEKDESGAVVDYRFNGETGGFDSCSGYHNNYYPIASAEAWCDCPGSLGGPVLGDPNGSTPGHP